MKMVMAVIRPEKLNDVLEALYRAEVTGLTISRVRGHGGETEQVETYRGTTVKVELHDKVRIEIGVSDPFVEPTVRAILAAGRTGDVGDGKIFVLPVEKVYRIRTGEEDRLESLWTDVFGVGFAQRWVDANGVRTRVLEAGDPANPPLLFLHGVNGHAEAYMRNLGPHAQDFHVFAVEWEASEIRWYVDDKLKFSVKKDVPRVPMRIVLNTAVGGNWPGNPTKKTVFPQLHEIDYVRVYKKTA
jgi:nitrogen regulatory protein P-II 1